MASLALAFDILAHDRASQEFDKVGASAEHAGKKGTAFGSAMKLGMLGAVVAVAEFAKKSVEAAIEGEGAHARLAQAVKNTGGSMEELEPKIRKVSAGMAKYGFTNDQVEKALGTMTTATGSAQKAMGMMADAADLAKYKHIDLADASVILARAQGGSMKAFKELGITLEHGVPKTVALKDAMDALHRKIGGQAAVSAETYSGKLDAMHARISNLQENIGNRLLPVISRLVTSLGHCADFVERNSAVIKPLAAILLTAGAAYLVVEKGIVVTNIALKIFKVGATEAGVATQIALGPVGLIIIAVAALAAGLIYAYNHSKTFRDIVNSVGSYLAGAFQQAMTGAQQIIHGVGSAFQAVSGFVGGLIGDVEHLINAISNIKLPSLGGIGKGISGAFSFGNALGTQSSTGGSFLTGEQGPERVYLPPGARVMTHAATMAADGAGSMTYLLEEVRGLRQDVQQHPAELQRLRRGAY